MHKLEADGIELFFGTRRILSNIYIKTETGSVTGLLARNGDGKTCLMSIIYGNLKTTARSVRINEHPLTEAFRRPDLLTYLPQFNFIPTSLTLQRAFKDFDLSYSDFEGFFPEFKDRQQERIGKLSGGERRLTEVYLLIKSKTQFTLLDEPFSHIMPLHVEKLSELIRQEKQHKGFIITDHMYQNVIAISDHIYLLKDGTTHHAKTIEEIEIKNHLFSYLCALK